ncbi:MAG: hypothetical protein M3R24_24905 [Chloroflexota bacterium]|nr:hypothetical protein [Chloroflexota bacterium]
MIDVQDVLTNVDSATVQTWRVARTGLQEARTAAQQAADAVTAHQSKQPGAVEDAARWAKTWAPEYDRLRAAARALEGLVQEREVACVVAGGDVFDAVYALVVQRRADTATAHYETLARVRALRAEADALEQTSQATVDAAHRDVDTWRQKGAELLERVT